MCTIPAVHVHRLSIEGASFQVTLIRSYTLLKYVCYRQTSEPDLHCEIQWRKYLHRWEFSGIISHLILNLSYIWLRCDGSLSFVFFSILVCTSLSPSLFLFLFTTIIIIIVRRMTHPNARRRHRIELSRSPSSRNSSRSLKTGFESDLFVLHLRSPSTATEENWTDVSDLARLLSACLRTKERTWSVHWMWEEVANMRLNRPTRSSLTRQEWAVFKTQRVCWSRHRRIRGENRSACWSK